MDIIKDTHKWDIEIILTNDKCPFLYYPINIHACKHPDFSNNRKHTRCELEYCPIRLL